MAAGVTAVLTSATCWRGLSKVGSVLGNGLGWLARTVYNGTDRGLRVLGKPGLEATDLLFAGVVWLGGKIAGIAAPVVHRVAHGTDPSSPQARVLSGIARSYVVHRAVRALIGNPILRLIVEGLFIPTLVDSRVLAWLRQHLRTVRSRA
ncbi:MAG: hypothetical protein NVSMB55_22840 [Mycobacteriales bacterium]